MSNLTEPGILRVMLTLMQRDLLLAFRHRAELVNPLLFFIIVVSLFPLGITPDKSTLQTIAPGILWVAALLATLISLDGIFREDLEDGSLEQLVLNPRPLGLLLLVKVFAHWLVTSLPLILVAPLLALLLFLPTEIWGSLLLTLLLGTPILSLIGGIGVALTVGLRKGGVLLSLLVLPLYIPVLIFGANALQNASYGMPITGQLYILAAMLVLALTLAPLAMAAAIRITLN